MQPLDLTRRDLLRAAGAVAVAYPFRGFLEGALLAADSPTKTQADNLALRFAKYYKPVKIETKPSIPGYDLPLDLDKIANFKEASAALGLTAEEASLKKNGFTVLSGKGNEDIVEPYKHLHKLKVPLFITADTLLHLYHVQFDETLKDIEEREFYKDVVALAETMVQELEAFKTTGDDANITAARTKALTFFTIGLKALKPDAPTPKGVAQNDVDEVLEQMKEHKGFWPSLATQPCPWALFRYSEDFSQYIPRGHYTRSETLKKYFVGMMWFGRLTFLLKGASKFGPAGEALVSPEEAKQQTIAAAMVTKLLDSAKLADGRKAYDVWERIYIVTSFYVGLADDLGFAENKESLTKVCGASLDLTVLADAKKFQALQVELAKHNPPAIYSGTGAAIAGPKEDGEELVKALDKTMGFRFMGQRFIPDSYMMGKLVFPSIGQPTRDKMFTRVEGANGLLRGFPRGLDVMAILGSDRARALLTELGDDAYAHTGKALSYDEALTELKKEYAALSDADWNRNLYWSWLFALKPLLWEYGKGYPSFMATTAYRTKSLNTALASWAQLRHDTILYAKQSYSMGAGGAPPKPQKPVEGYVEPLPEFYARLLALSRMTSAGLGEMKVLNDAAKQRLTAFESILERLLAIVEKELADKELTAQDYAYIRSFGEHLQNVVVPPTARGENQAMKTTLAADVHTDQNSKQVLEEATGYVDLGVFVYRQPDGRLVIGAGPVLSYYEFKQPMADRLTDEKWRELLKSDKKPASPEWTKEYVSAKGTYTCPPQHE